MVESNADGERWPSCWVYQKSAIFCWRISSKWFCGLLRAASIMRLCRGLFSGDLSACFSFTILRRFYSFWKVDSTVPRLSWSGDDFALSPAYAANPLPARLFRLMNFARPTVAECWSVSPAFSWGSFWAYCLPYAMSSRFLWSLCLYS